MKFKLLMIRWKDYVLSDSIRTSLFVFFSCLIIIAILTLSTIRNGYSNSFFENILVEAHGMLFDILIIGVLLYWMNTHGEKTREIKRLKDELSYYNEYTEPEATFHVSKIIKQLHNLGAHDNNLVRLYLEDASLLGIQFSETNFIGNWLSRAFFHIGEFMNCKFVKSECIATNFTEAELTLCEFIECRLDTADFSDATLHHVTFKKCKMTMANFENSYLNLCNFPGAVLNDVVFKNATLHKCDLTKYENLQGCDFDGTTLEKCKLLKKDLPLFSKATLLETEIC